MKSALHQYLLLQLWLLQMSILHAKNMPHNTPNQSQPHSTPHPTWFLMLAPTHMTTSTIYICIFAWCRECCFVTKISLSPKTSPSSGWQEQDPGRPILEMCPILSPSNFPDLHSCFTRQDLKLDHNIGDFQFPKIVMHFEMNLPGPLGNQEGGE